MENSSKQYADNYCCRNTNIFFHINLLKFEFPFACIIKKSSSQINNTPDDPNCKAKAVRSAAFLYFKHIRKEPKDYFDVWYLCQLLNKKFEPCIDVDKKRYRQVLGKYLPVKYGKVLEEIL